MGGKQNALTANKDVPMPSVGMSLQSILEINLGFMKDLRSYEAHVTVDGETTTISGEDFEYYSQYGMTIIRIPIGAMKVRSEYTISLHVPGGERVSPTYICSAEGFAKNYIAGTSDETAIALATAMMRYGDAVIAAFPNA